MLSQRRFVTSCCFTSSFSASSPLSSSLLTTAFRSQSTRSVYSSPTQRIKQHHRKGASSGIDNPRWKTEHDGHIRYRQQPTGSGKANPNMADFANAKVKHWHMWLMVGACAVGGYFAGQNVSIDPKKLNPKDNNTGDRKIGKLDLKSAVASEEQQQ